MVRTARCAVRAASGGAIARLQTRLEIPGNGAQTISHARVAELADAPDLGSGSERIGGSIPPARTNLKITGKFYNLF